MRQPSSGFTRHGMLRDNQRRKVYKFEHTYNSYEQTLTIEECQEFVDYLLTRHMINARTQQITVTPGKGGRGARYYYNSRKMVLNRSCRNRLVICHEFAHAIVGVTSTDEPHGSLFVTIMLNLQMEYANDEATRPWSEILEDARAVGSTARL